MSMPSPAKQCLTPDRVLSVLQHHIGRDHGIGIGNLVFAATGEQPDLAAERYCRRLISELREGGTAICGTPRTGYYIAANAAELDECCQFLRKRAMTSLRVESRLRKIALPDLVKQLRFHD
ncbi:hypothetical protein BN2364_1082 [Alloalcanivorax xenomutans]|uniref:hypothetical protein n=1 Tax=Alloalcanivorax xenomutans TaxID=1094342 RepID=UPI0006D5BC54|nr:hypothetical protein [Alloalcanivorax xenomutans]CUR45523.1 hypothetical protein BN2364_1082 [Alloalcanivorax xenomutans]